MKVFAALALSFALVAPAGAQNAQPVKIQPVAVTGSGRMIVQSNGATFIEIQPSEFNEKTAQEIYEQHRSKMRELILEDEAERANKNMEYDMAERAGLYRNTDTNVPIKNSFVGISLTDGKRVDGLKFVPTRQQRLYSRENSYILANPDRESGAVVTANCHNPQGAPDVMNVNFGHSGCFGSIKLFKKIK